MTPAAKTAFDRAVALDPSDARARYFQGVIRDQAGDHAGAVDLWVTLLKSAPAGAPWAADVRETLTQVAGQAGISLTGRLPADTASATVAPPPLGASEATVGAIPQPSAEQAAAVRAMAPDAQQAMIRQMVDGLAARLKTNPQDPDGWLRLIRARMVQGDVPAAVRGEGGGAGGADEPRPARGGNQRGEGARRAGGLNRESPTVRLNDAGVRSPPRGTAAGHAPRRAGPPAGQSRAARRA